MRPTVVEGEVSDGRLDALLTQGWRLDQAIYQLMWERMNAKFMREIFKPEYLVDLPGVDRDLPTIDLTVKGK